MGYGKLNIWLRYAVDCSLIKTCWRTDLVIKTCNGEYLVEMDPTVLEKLKTKYSEYDVSKNPAYEGETRIKFFPPVGKYINHIEVDIPPGCYVVWTRVCYIQNEETQKVMVIVNCEGEACVNLLLDKTEKCVKEMLYPGAVRAIKLGLPKRELGTTVKQLLEIAEVPKEVFISDLQQKLEELKDIGKEEAREYLEPTKILLEIVNEL